MGLSQDESVKVGARLGPRWSSVCVGVDTRQGGLRAYLPTQGALNVRAARVACRSLLLTCGLLGGLWTTACMAKAVCARELLWDQMIVKGLFVL